MIQQGMKSPSPTPVSSRRLIHDLDVGSTAPHHSRIKSYPAFILRTRFAETGFFCVGASWRGTTPLPPLFGEERLGEEVHGEVHAWYRELGAGMAWDED